MISVTPAGKRSNDFHQSKHAFPNTPNALFWALRAGFDDNLNVWTIDFGNGRAFGGSGSPHNLRRVRNN